PMTNGTSQMAKCSLPSMPQMPLNANGTEPGFRNASGDTWDGNGEMPEWLNRAVHAGQDIESGRVGAGEAGFPGAQRRQGAGVSTRTCNRLGKPPPGGRNEERPAGRSR